MSRSAFSLATSRLSCELLGLHLAVAWKGLLWIVGELLHPVAQLRRVNVQVLRRLRIRYASILNQAHRLKLELPRKLPSLHDPPPAPSKHLTRCLRNRVQAMASGAGPRLHERVQFFVGGLHNFCGVTI